MKTIRLIQPVILISLFLLIGACKEEYQLGDLTTPTNLTLSYEVEGAGKGTPNGDGSGIVHFTATADHAITFNYEFGDGSDNQVAPDGKVSHRFSKNGVNTYNVTVFAVGTGGIQTTSSAQLEVFSSFSDDEALEFLTGGSTKTWYWAYNVPAFTGLGPTNAMMPQARRLCRFQRSMAAATIVEPQPANGSRTTSPNCEDDSISC